MINKLNPNFEIDESLIEYSDEESINNESSIEYSDEESIDYESLTEFQKKVHYLENNLDLGVGWGTQVEKWFGENEYIYYYHCSFNLNYVRKQIYSNGTIEYDSRPINCFNYEENNVPNFNEYYTFIDGICDLCLDSKNYYNETIPYYKKSIINYNNQKTIKKLPSKKYLLLKYTKKNYDYWDIANKEFYVDDILNSYSQYAVLADNGVSIPIIDNKILKRREKFVSDLNYPEIINLCHILQKHGIEMPSSIKWIDKKNDVMEEIYTMCVCGEGVKEKAVWQTYSGINNNDPESIKFGHPILTDITCSEEYVKNIIINNHGSRYLEDVSSYDNWYLKKKILKFRVECKCLCSCNHRRI